MVSESCVGLQTQSRRNRGTGADAGYAASPVGIHSLVGLSHHAHFHEHCFLVVGPPYGRSLGMA